jgi:hypothetical protein
VRVFKSSLLYGDYLEAFYSRRPALSTQPFSTQMTTLLSDGFSFGDAWTHYLQSTGRYEVMETVVNAEPAQKMWAQEHMCRHSAEQWTMEILQAQLAAFKPDVWFCHSWIAPEARIRLRASCPSIRFVVGYDGALKHSPEGLAGCDAVLTCVRETAAFYTRSGLKGYWLPWGFDCRIRERIRPPAEQHGAVFSGSLGLLEKQHFGRVKLLGRLRTEPGFSLHIRGLSGLLLERQILSSIKHRQWSTTWQMLQHYQSLTQLRSVNLGSRFGLEMFTTFAGARIVLNLHGDAVTTAANMRLFEATGVGSCLLTDWKDDLKDSFDPDTEIVTFRSYEECAEKLRYLLDHEFERQAIAAAGQRRCLRDHRLGDRIVAFAERAFTEL